ncbi:hypothetical protein [Streptomyces sp. NPDC059708]|uniref:hypothetical protein n=1 Tax=Streptomyces sp. NPDC059708 TaxID=3346916 RepID=UPI0036CD6D3B
MVQLRVMTDDAALGEEVLAVLVPLLRACTALRVGEPTRLTHRGGGLRVVLDVQPADPSPVRVERVTPPDSPRRRARAALPPRTGRT